VRALVLPGPSGAAGVAVMTERLRRLGVTDVHVVEPGDAAEQFGALGAGLSGRTLLVDGDLIVADASLGQLVDDPAVRSGALVLDGAAPAGSGGSAPPVRVTQRRITSAGSAVHDVSAPSAAFLGALVIDEHDLGQATAILRAALDTLTFAGWDADPLDLALVSLVRGQVPVAAVSGVGPALRGGSSSARVAAMDQLASVDEARVLLERSNRPDDGFYSTFVLRRVSKPLTALALRLHLSPNQVSLFSLVVGLSAAVCFALGSWWGLLAGALLMQASLVVDCVDGEVARFTRSFSDLGAWLDASTDRVKEYAAYAGLAAGSVRSGEDIWLLATLVMVMQTVRHVGDYDFSRVQRIRESWVPARPLLDPSDGGAAGAGGTLALSAQLNRDNRVRWGKKILHMPIGERWLVLSVGAVTIGPRWTLLLMLGLGTLALAYTTVGRILRSRTWGQPPERSGAHLLEPQLDLGPLGSPLWNVTLARLRPLAGAFGWAWPAGMRVVELGAVWLAVDLVAPDEGAWLFGWVFVVAFHHYDTLYRALGGAAPPRWLVWAGLGWDGRTVLVLVAAALGAGALSGLLSWGTPLLGLLLVVIASVQWVGTIRRKDGAHA
jgi:phosphatidylglycerophosphate synthase